MASSPAQNHHRHRHQQTTRRATASDLDAIVAVAIVALPADPVNPYRYPRWRDFPDDYAHHTRLRYAAWLADPSNVVMVCEVPAEDSGCSALQEEEDRPTGSLVVSSGKHVVAFSIWELPPSQRSAVAPVLHDQQSSAPGSPPASAPATEGSLTGANTTPSSAPSTERRDANPSRVQKYAQEFTKAKQHFFEHPYGQHNLYLSILACHPSYQRRGIGRQLVRWGLEKAKLENLDMTVFGSPMGSLLYRSVGFREVGKFRVQVDGEEEYLDTLAMVLENKDIP